MAEKYYMVNDLRADHSMRVPRPDLTEKIGAPNACSGCHADQTLDWSVDAFHEWWGKGPRNAHYGEHLAAARRGQPGSLDRLLLLAADPDIPGIVRATALNDLQSHPLTPEQIQAAQARLDDPDPLVRRESVTLLEKLPARERLPLVGPLLRDPIASVRTEAARVLAAAATSMPPEQRALFDEVSDEFLTQQKAIFDRAAGHMRIALFHLDLGLPKEAEAAYRQGVKIEPDAVPVWVNLGELLYQQNRMEEAEASYRSGVKNARMEENRGVALDALARFLIRQKRYDEGVVELKEAARRLPENAQVQYFLGVALNSTGKFEDALGYLRKAHELAPNHSEYLVGLATICRDAGRYQDAWEAAKKLAALNPDDRQSQQLLEQIRQMRN
jgi:tetratricopeptide (TPR) repeat protein